MAGNLYDSQITTYVYGKHPNKIYDGDGLFLSLSKIKTGTSRRFVGDYSLNGKRKQISYGKYPDIGLSQARTLHQETRALAAKGVDPVEARRERRKALTADVRTVDVLAAEYFESRNDWKPSHRAKELCRWDKHVSPFIGSNPIKSVTRKQVKARLRDIQNNSIDTARRVQSLIDQVFSFAEASDDLDENPVAGLSRVLKKHKQKHYPKITDPERLGPLLLKIDKLPSVLTRAGLQIVALTGVRHSGIREAEWSEIDFDRKRWTIPARRMKVSSNGDHIIPLSRQVLAAFEELKAINSQHRYVLTTGIPKRGEVIPLSNGTLNKALAECVPKSEHVVHSFRGTAYTILKDKGYDAELVKLQMHHARGGVQGAYDDSVMVKDRSAMLQWYADFLDQCREQARGR